MASNFRQSIQRMWKRMGQSVNTTKNRRRASISSRERLISANTYVPIIGILMLVLLVTLVPILGADTVWYQKLGFSEPSPLNEHDFKDLPDPDEIHVVYMRDLPRAKAPWDWLELMIVPAALAGMGLWFSWAQRRHEIDLARKREVADEHAIESRAQEAALQIYLDRMTELLLEKRLCEPSAPEEVREIARVRTLTIIRRLNEKRVRYVIQFLHDMGLIRDEEPILSLRGASLRYSYLKSVQLPGVCLRMAALSESNLSSADLSESQLEGVLFNKADLSSANLQCAYLVSSNLVKADLRYADLRGANLEKANATEVNLYKANLTDATLTGANLKDANLEQTVLAGVQFDEKTQWPENFEPPEKSVVEIA